MLSAWRIVAERHAAQAFSGEGARVYGGRWNSPGVAMVYTAQSRSLAALEILVHLESPQLLRKYLLFEVVFDAALVFELDRGVLPADWRDNPVPLSTQAIGDRWVARAAVPVMCVPSAIIADENNFLLNLKHPEFKRLKIHEPVRFAFDSRLVRR
jgi:RES domain-containing protein